MDRAGPECGVDAIAEAWVRCALARAARLRPLLGVLAVCVIGLAAPAAAAAATLHVTSSADSGAGTLRDAIAMASDGDTVVIDPGVNPTLTSGGGIPIGHSRTLPPPGNLTIVGQGARATTVTGDSLHSTFSIGVGSGTVSVTGLTLTGGGGIGSLQNTSPGGAINVSRGSLALNDVTLTNNNAGYFGSGGAIYFSGSTMSLTRVTVVGNVSQGGGGGIYFAGSSATISDSTIVGNSDQAAGGGVYVSGPTTFINDTLSGNNDGHGGSGDNIATSSSSGVTATLQNTIVSNAANSSNCAGSGFISSGHNLEDTTPSQCGLSAAQGDLIGVNPVLSPLANNGGPTDTMALGTGSPAVDAVPAANCPIALDQRGLPRRDSSESSCDIGAYEFQDSTPRPTAVVAGCSPSAVLVGQTTTCTATVTDQLGAGAGTPTGVVTFTGSGPGGFGAGGTCMLAGSGASASCSVPFTPSAAGSGADIITAAYAGDAAHQLASGSTSLAVASRSTSLAVNAPTSAAVSCSPGTVLIGKSTTCTATVSAAGNPAPGSPTGSVSFTSTGAGGISGGGSCTLAQASCSVTYTLGASSSGTYTVTAAYGGDATHARASAMTSLAVAPVAGVTANVTVISGTVLIKLPRATSFVPLALRAERASSDGFVPLKGATVSVPIESTIDAHLKGAAVKVATAADYRPATDGRHSVQTGTFAAAIFTIEQDSARRAAQRLHRKRSRLRGTPATDLRLRTPAGAVSKARCHRHGAPGSGLVRTLSGRAKGLFRTIGATSITTVRSAVWIVADRCDGTLTEVGSGHAAVTNLRHRHQHTQVVGPGQGILIKGRFL